MKEKSRNELSRWQKMLGIQRINRDSIDFNWGYFNPEFGLELSSRTSGEENYKTIDFCLLWGKFSIYLKFLGSKEPENFITDMYGFYIFDRIFFFCWGDTLKSWILPFVNYELEKRINIGEPQTLDYQYRLNSGKVQYRKARCTKERMVWKMKWVPFIKKYQTIMNVELDDEVGEETGSWKGGALGFGDEMKPGETMRECLTRIEKERKF